MSIDLMLAILLFVSVIMAAAMALAWQQFGREKYILQWVGAYLSASVQWLLNWGGMEWNSTLLMYGSGIAMIASIAFAYSGIALRRDSRAALWPVLLSAFVTVALVSILALTVGNDINLVFIIPAFAASALAIGATKLFPKDRVTRPAECVCASLLLLFSAFELVLMALGFKAVTTQLPFWRDAYRITLSLGLPALVISSGIATILVVAGDLSAKLLRLSLQDHLTSVLNRRGLEEIGGRAIASAHRRKAPLSLIAFDLDKFKQLNDLHGHAAGDTALQYFAEVVQRARRQDDVVARLGGDEFIILLSNASQADALAVVDRIHEQLNEVAFAQAPHGKLSFSFGIADLAEQERLHDLIARADTLLYDSKRLKAETMVAKERA